MQDFAATRAWSIRRPVIYISLSYVSHHGYRVAMVLCEVRIQAEEIVGIKHIMQHSTNTWQHSVEINVRFALRIKKLRQRRH